ncbi:putative methyltransferase [Holotrichia oblita]|uniref:Methyltransferase n=1 Tax=Holotrichia oblita TaxID=644536 RepID=A0ACB9TDY8_HOLOL|nr:putative methyltransferase [Holotrichia oblita]
MGRTARKRKRRLKYRECDDFSLESLQNTILLKKSMQSLGWKNDSKLILKNFVSTGRGVSSLLNIKSNQKLIEIPYNLLITCANAFELDLIQNLCKASNKFKAQEILAVFLILEKHKNKNSKWKFYLDTLPEELPTLPWLCTEAEFSMYPSYLMAIVSKKKWDLEIGWERVEKSINSSWICPCCEQPLNRVVTLNAFTWGYVVVNTRAVYVDPGVAIKLFGRDLSNFLSDAPCLALCPFLDMFNHSAEANTRAELICVGDSWKYTLTTLTSYKKYRQIFISYGSHDNDKLFCEYGFFLIHNHLNNIRCSLEEVLSVSNISLNKKQRAFIENRCLPSDVYVSTTGLSFYLKALFYVLIKPDVEWGRVIYSEDYSSCDIMFMCLTIKKILSFKKAKFIEDLKS